MKRRGNLLKSPDFALVVELVVQGPLDVGIHVELQSHGPLQDAGRCRRRRRCKIQTREEIIAGALMVTDLAHGGYGTGRLEN